MSTPAAKLMVFASEQYACVKISGRANFTFSPDFKSVVTGLHSKGYKDFAVDLTDCVLMDSTFLGVLTEFALLLSHAAEGSPEPKLLELCNPNARITELLESLGVLHLFKICQGTPKVCSQTAPKEATAEPASREQVTRTCLKAHETLMSVNPDNATRFKEVTKFLAEDLKKMEKQ